MALAPRDIDDFDHVVGQPPPLSEDSQPWAVAWHAWIQTHALSADDRAAIVARIAAMPRLRISVLMPVHNPRVDHLIAAINSVRSQLYPDWELCIADDCSTDAEVISVLQRFASCDPRIKLTYRSTPGHIAHASNDALALATGAYVALLDHDDLLTEHALYMVAEELQACPQAAIIYSDEDKVDDNNIRFGAYFKQHFNTDNLLGQNCINHLGVFCHARVREVGGFRPGTEGAQDYDLTWRVLERAAPGQIRHIPHILYHWRATQTSTALHPEAKGYAFEAGRRAIAEHMGRTGEACSVQHGVQPGVYRVKRDVPRAPASLIVTDFTPTARPGRQDAAWLAAFCKASPPCHQVLTAPAAAEPGAWARAANAAAAAATGDILLFVQAGLWPTHAQALAELATQAWRPEVGAAGARLQTADGTMVHDGYTMGLGGVCGSMHAGIPVQSSGYFGLNAIARQCAAVDGRAMAVRRETFLAMGGFDVSYAAAWADVDLCLRLGQRGHAVVHTPFAAFILPPGATAAPLAGDTFRLMHRHRAAARHDPFWNPNLVPQPGTLALAQDVRALQPWRRPWRQVG